MRAEMSLISPNLTGEDGSKRRIDHGLHPPQLTHLGVKYDLLVGFCSLSSSDDDIFLVTIAGIRGRYLRECDGWSRTGQLRARASESDKAKNWNNGKNCVGCFHLRCRSFAIGSLTNDTRRGTHAPLHVSIGPSSDSLTPRKDGLQVPA